MQKIRKNLNGILKGLLILLILINILPAVLWSAQTNGLILFKSFDMLLSIAFYTTSFSFLGIFIILVILGKDYSKSPYPEYGCVLVAILLIYNLLLLFFLSFRNLDWAY